MLSYNDDSRGDTGDGDGSWKRHQVFRTWVIGADCNARLHVITRDSFVIIIV
jgi:hypothetical protein